MLQQSTHPKLLMKQLQTVFGHCWPKSYLRQIQQELQLIQPEIHTLFWQSRTSEPGIYIILRGKVRLVDRQQNLLLSLGPGETFGELTLFPEAAFRSYNARTSSERAELGFISAITIRTLLSKQHTDYSELYQYAQSKEQRFQAGSTPLQRPGFSGPSEITWPSSEQKASQPCKRKPVYFPAPRVRLGHLWHQATRQYPFFEQQSASDCGAACLAMIARYWGKQLSMNRLRELAHIDRNGASLLGLSTAAERIGFSTRPVKTNVEQLARQSLPAIVHWEGKHFIVVYAVTAKGVIVADPAIGQRHLSHQAFEQGWTSYALLLQPTPRLKKTKEEQPSFWHFIELLRPHKLVIFEIVVTSLLIQVFGLVTPLLTQLLLDRVVVQRSVLTLNTVGFGLLLFGLFRVGMTALRQYLLDHTANRIDLALIVGFIRHTLHLPLSFFESRYVGDIIARVQENRKIQRFLTGESLSITLDLLTVFIYLGLMFWYSWKLAFLILLIGPPFLLLALFVTPFLRKVSREIFSAHATENSYLIEALTGIRTVKSMAVEQGIRWRWEGYLHRAVKTQFSGQVLGNQLQLFSSGIQTLATTALLWFGAWLVIHNELTIGQLVAFNMLLGNVIGPFQRLTLLWNELQEVLIATERINDVLQVEPEEALLDDVKQSLPPLEGRIQFEHVSFRYHPDQDRNVLENISFEVKPGQTVAIVGRSGSGKTTLSKLLLGLYQATEGCISIDGHDINHLALTSVRGQIGVVDQDTFLFGGTIRDNLALGKPNAKLEDIIAAARQAGADEFIQTLPMGYETRVGEGGGGLSGGQRQRLAIARALLSNPRLLIFDEATSHLDTESERIIQNNLTQICQSRTTFIIAHRLSTVRQADLILVLDRGILIEQGTHAELIAKRGQYFYLNRQQLDAAV